MRSRKDLEILQLEREINAKVLRLAELSADTRMTFYWNGLTHTLRNRGKLLPGDGKGGLLPRKG
jgi:hypothetical protein